MMSRSYSEMIKLKSFEERYNYLKLSGSAGVVTFGFDRYLNQTFYTSYKWKQVRRDVIVRDEACDLAIPERSIFGGVRVHHMNPIAPEIWNLRKTLCLIQSFLFVLRIIHIMQFTLEMKRIYLRYQKRERKEIRLYGKHFRFS